MPYSLINLPDPALEAIFSNLTFDELAKCRLVCKRLDDVCGHLLNRGFYTARPFLNSVEEKIKKKMPRKSTERNNSIFINHQVMLWQIDIELRRLNAIYAEYLEAGKCYFIPGKVLDRIYSALIYLQKCNTKPRINLNELENLSIMATEHFLLNILPVIRYRKTNRYYVSNNQLDFSLDQFSADTNTSTLFFADEQPRIEFSTDKQRATTSSGSGYYASENSGGENSATDYSGNDSSPDENVGNEVPTDRYAGKCAGSQLSTAALSQPGCSWMNESNPREEYNEMEKNANEIQYLKASLWHHSLQISAQDYELSKQASLIRGQNTKISQMEDTLAEYVQKYTQLEKRLEILYNNYAHAKKKEEIEGKAGPSQITQNTSDSSPPGVKRMRTLEESDEETSE